jgi:long-subunit acyl-CoA synthetase (AMP-forming)
MMLLICNILVGTEGFPKGVMLTSRNIVNDGYYIGKT